MRRWSGRRSSRRAHSAPEWDTNGRPSLPGPVRGALVLVGIAVVTVFGFLAPTRVPRMLAGFDVFRVEEVAFEGLTWTRDADVLAAAGIDGGTNVWEPLDSLEARIESHPMVIEADVRRHLPRGLEVNVVERVPVGLVATPTLEPIDRDGRYLPVNPAEVSLDLPILVPLVDPDAEDPRPAESRLVNLGRLADAMRRDAVFGSRVSEVREMEDGIVVAEWGDPAVAFELRSEADLRRLREGLTALDDAIQKDGVVPDAVDLKWAGLVVLRHDN